ncbi:MAG: uroporphyrinogen-III synthase [Pirellulales bacterium]|nr:uroporphyrinogen-III synthase [Pirellulales bacterium]
MLITRPRRQAHELCWRFEELGAKVQVQAAVEIAPPDDWGPVDAILARLEEFDWLVFSSTNGVNYLIERLCLLTGSEQIPEGLKLAAIGPGTAEELKKHGLHAKFVPREYRAEALADGLVDVACLSDGCGKRFLLARASRGRQVLSDRLVAAGAIVEEVVVYESRDILPNNPDIMKVAVELEAGRVDWVTVTSSAIARSIVQLFGEKLERAKLASISPITSGVLRELGFEPAAEAVEYSVEGVIQAILAEKRKRL